jgi:hypothetical protein
MAKIREQWSATVAELVSSAKRNRGITDYITPGFVFMTTVNDTTQTPGSEVVANHGGTEGSITNIPLDFSVGLVHYTPATSLWDRMLVVAAWEIEGATSPTLEHQLPGAGQVAFTLADPVPVAITLPSDLFTVSVDIGSGAETVILDSVASAGWIHINWNTTVLPPEDAFTYFVWGMLYSSADSPF